MAGESVVINGKAIGVTTSLNNKPTVFNPDTDYVFIGRINDNGVIIAGFRVKLTDLAEDYAGELLQDVQLVIENGENDLTDLTTEKKAELENYTNSTLKSSLDSYTSDKKDEISTYVTTVVLPKFNQDVAEILTQAEDSATQASNAAKNAEDSASAAEESKKAAATSATNAATSEKNAGDSASEAEESKKAAATSATNAAASEKNAKESEESASQSATEAEQAKTDMQSALDKIQEMYAAFLLDKKRGGMKVGIPYSWLGKSSTIPERAMICDGRELDKDDPDYADLYAIIGTTYGESEDGTKFRIPNFRDCIDQNGDIDPEVEGVFIRATTKDEDVGKKEFDAIRDIRGGGFNFATIVPNSITLPYKYGAFSIQEKWNNIAYLPGVASCDFYGLFSFAASDAVPTDSEVRPYAIRLLYVIAY